MNTSSIALIASLMFISACTHNHSHSEDSSHENSDGTHVHDDGTTHDDHDNGQAKKEEIKQEEFTADTIDSADSSDSDHSHDHGDGDHTH